jgi:periplasmic divalent cation tolerance protein
MKLLEAFTTVGNEADALRLAELSVQRGLAACVQMTPVKSVYRWQGQLQRDAEIQLAFKTTEASCEALHRAVLAAHPYELPAWQVLEVAASDDRFAAWVRAGASGHPPTD